MPKHFNGLTPAEAERLALLIEECGEVIQAATKVLRHGYESRDPTLHKSHSPTNREALANEMGHVQHAMGRLMAMGDVRPNLVNEATWAKARNVGRWLHHQGEEHGG